LLDIATQFRDRMEFENQNFINVFPLREEVV
jgi:hypothetical protein